MHTDAIGWSSSGSVRLLDQAALPTELRYLEADSVEAMAEAIRALRVRGAPLICIASAMGWAAEAAASVFPQSGGLTGAWLDAAAARLASARPTAVNLGWAV